MVGTLKVFKTFTFSKVLTFAHFQRMRKTMAWALVALFPMQMPNLTHILQAKMKTTKVMLRISR
jgi:hypothetical protein